MNDYKDFFNYFLKDQNKKIEVKFSEGDKEEFDESLKIKWKLVVSILTMAHLDIGIIQERIKKIKKSQENFNLNKFCAGIVSATKVESEQIPEDREYLTMYDIETLCNTMFELDYSKDQIYELVIFLDEKRNGKINFDDFKKIVI